MERKKSSCTGHWGQGERGGGGVKRWLWVQRTDTELHVDGRVGRVTFSFVIFFLIYELSGAQTPALGPKEDKSSSEEIWLSLKCTVHPKIITKSHLYCHSSLCRWELMKFNRKKIVFFVGPLFSLYWRRLISENIAHNIDWCLFLFVIWVNCPLFFTAKYLFNRSVLCLWGNRNIYKIWFSKKQTAAEFMLLNSNMFGLNVMIT